LIVCLQFPLCTAIYYQTNDQLGLHTHIHTRKTGIKQVPF